MCVVVFAVVCVAGDAVTFAVVVCDVLWVVCFEVVTLLVVCFVAVVCVCVVAVVCVVTTDNCVFAVVRVVAMLVFVVLAVVRVVVVLVFVVLVVVRAVVVLVFVVLAVVRAVVVLVFVVLAVVRVVAVLDSVVLAVVRVVAVLVSVVLVSVVLLSTEVAPADAEVLVCVVDSVETAVSVVVVTRSVAVVVSVDSSGSRFRKTFRKAISSPLAMLNPSRQVPDVMPFSSGIPGIIQPSNVRSSARISTLPDDMSAYSSALYPAGIGSIHRRYPARYVTPSTVTDSGKSSKRYCPSALV